MIILSFPSKLILVSDSTTARSVIDILWWGKENTWVLEISSDKSPLENEQIPAVVFEKYITVMQLFWSKFGVEQRLPPIL